MVSHDRTHGAFREGAPPNRSGDDRDATSRKSLANSALVHAAMLAVAGLLRVTAVVVGGWAVFWTYFAMWFRMEGSSELQMIKMIDLKLGGALALAVILFFLPDSLKKPTHCLLLLAIATLVWVCVSGSLICLHEWQHLVRSGL